LFSLFFFLLLCLGKDYLFDRDEPTSYNTGPKSKDKRKRKKKKKEKTTEEAWNKKVICGEKASIKDLSRQNCSRG
jgi:hypothetical protein